MVHTFDIQGPRRRARLRLQGSFFVIGRAEPFPVFQDDPTISREHAVVVATKGGVAVKDLGSRNGVLLNGRRLNRYEEVLLAPGDEVLVGKTTLRWLREQEAEAPGGESEVTVDHEGRSSARLPVPRPSADLPPAEEEEEEPADEAAELEKTQVDDAPEEESGGEETEDLDVPPELVEQVRATGLGMEATQAVERPEPLPMPVVEAEAGTEAEAERRGSLASPSAEAPEPAPEVLPVPDDDEPAALDESDVDAPEAEPDDDDAPGADDETEPGRPILE